ncbi:MAG TPA: Hsp70 family protein [Pseudonocardiaceae bacterium]|jgi:molecular chaperone DnaK (HSP70)|nr:Hsp70 family protein [Pseudonocardiaceae bacterium]
MPYVLGIDVGTSRTRAAVCRNDTAGWSDPVPIPLGARNPGVPTVVYLAADRSALVGDQAERQAAGDPVRVARGFPGRIGDHVPLVLGGVQCSPQELTAVLVRWVVDRVAEHEGGPADAVVVTHPAAWGGHRKTLLHHELVRQELPDTTLLAEPIAVAEGCPARHVGDGDALAVYGLGAGTATSAVVRRTPAGRFDLLTDATGADAVGGGHFDDAIVECVRAQLGRGALDDIDPADPQAWLAMARLRGMCTGAKEMLSAEAEVIVPVRLPDAPADVRVSRTDFEDAIRPAVTAGADLLPRTVRAAGVEPTDLAAVVLTGGSVRVPLVAELVSAATPATALRAAEPELTVALGAAVAARRIVTGPEPVIATRSETAEPTEVIARSAIARYAGDHALDLVEVDDEFGVQPPARPPVEILPIELPAPPLVTRVLSNVRPATLTVSTIALAAVGVVLTFVLQSGGHPTNPLQHLGPAQPAANRTTATAPAPPGR